MLHETARAQLQVPQKLAAHKKMGLSSCSQLLLLASDCMALARESKSPIQIAGKTKFFSNFAWLFPKHKSMFQVSATQSVDHKDL